MPDQSPRFTPNLVNLRKIATHYLWRIHLLHTKACHPSQNCNNIFVEHPFASHQGLSTFAKLQQRICGASICFKPKLANLCKIATTYLWRIHSLLTKACQPSQNCNNIFVAYAFALHQDLSTFAKLQQHICGVSIRFPQRLANLRKIAATYLWRIHLLHIKNCQPS